jgi:hypothetical protein
MYNHAVSLRHYATAKIYQHISWLSTGSVIFFTNHFLGTKYDFDHFPAYTLYSRFVVVHVEKP